MKILQTIENTENARIRIQRRDDNSNYATYSAVTHITKEWDHDKTWYFVLHHESGETSTFSTKDWKILRETFVEFM